MTELLPFLLGLLSTAIGGGLGVLVWFLNSKKETASGFERVAWSLASAATTAVKAVSQTYADALKSASVDGKLTPSEQQYAMSLALAKMKSYVSFDELGKLLSGGTSAVEALALDQIEAKVRDQKIAIAIPK